MGFRFRFLGGQLDGQEFPLRTNREIVIGRGSEYDMVLEEDMVSRRHAKVSTHGGVVTVEDLDSTNGTFVNGDAVTRRTLEVGDEVSIGSVTLVLIESATAPQVVETSTATTAAPAGNRRTVARLALEGQFPEEGVTVGSLVSRVMMSGKPASIALRDSNGSRVKVYVLDKRIVWAKLMGPTFDEDPCWPKKALFRALAMESGSYRVRGFDREREFPGAFDDSPAQLIDEGEAQASELSSLTEQIPGIDERLSIMLPLESRLAELTDELLDTLQIIINDGNIREVLDRSNATDLETWHDIRYLLQNDYVILNH